MVLVASYVEAVHVFLPALQSQSSRWKRWKDKELYIAQVSHCKPYILLTFFHCLIRSERGDCNARRNSINIDKTKLNWPESASELYRPSDRRLSTKLVSTVAGRGWNVVSVTNPYGRNLDFLDRSRYFLFQVAPQMYSRGWVDPVPDPLLLRKSGIAGNRTRASGSVGRNSDY
jgi:hypothetical protein